LATVAVKVAGAPEHIVVAAVETTTDGVVLGFTVISMELEETSCGLAQLAFDSISTLIKSRFDSEASEYVGEFVPTLLPFFFQW